MSARKPPGPAGCGPCVRHDHTRCITTPSPKSLGARLIAAGVPTDCACAASRHEPDDALAAQMRAYERPDLAGAPNERLAADWYEAQRAHEVRAYEAMS